MPADRDLAVDGTRNKNVGHKYKCQLCPYSAENSTALQRHKDKHGQKTLLCPFPDCDYKTYPSTKYNLDTHINRHLEYKPYKCLDDPSACEFATCDPSSLLRHRKSYHGYKPGKKIPQMSDPEPQPPCTGKTFSEPSGRYVSATLRREINEKANPAAIYDQFNVFRVTLSTRSYATPASSVSSSDTLPELTEQNDVDSVLDSEQPGVATCPIVIDDDDDDDGVDLPRGGPMMPSDLKPCFYSESPDTDSVSFKMESPEHSGFIELSPEGSMSPPQCFRCCLTPDNRTHELDPMHVDNAPVGLDQSACRSGAPAFHIKQEPELEPLELDFKANLPAQKTLGYGSSLPPRDNDTMMVDVKPFNTSAYQPKREISPTPELEVSAAHFTACQPNDNPAALRSHSFPSRAMQPFVVRRVFYSVSYAPRNPLQHQRRYL